MYEMEWTQSVGPRCSLNKKQYKLVLPAFGSKFVRAELLYCTLNIRKTAILDTTKE